MSDKVISIAGELSDELSKTECCARFCHYKQIVGADPILYNRIKDFKKAQIEFEYRELQDSPLSFEEEKNVSKLYSELVLNDNARHYLESEKAVLELFSRIIDIVSAACKIDIEL